MHSPYFWQLLSNGPILAGHSPGLTGALWKWKQQQEVTKHTLKNKHPAGEPSTSPQISTRIFRGIPVDHPCGNLLIISLWKFVGIEGTFRCGYFRRLSLWNPWGYFHVKIALVFPSKFQNAIQWHRKGPCCGKYPSDNFMSLFGEL